MSHEGLLVGLEPDVGLEIQIHVRSDGGHVLACEGETDLTCGVEVTEDGHRQLLGQVPDVAWLACFEDLNPNQNFAGDGRSSRWGLIGECERTYLDWDFDPLLRDGFLHFVWICIAGRCQLAFVSGGRHYDFVQPCC